jgi:hypothetical protein
MTDQYLRKCGLVVTSGSKGLDLSQMRIRFKVNAMDVDRPATAVIRVSNLSADTARQVEKEFQTVSLQAGYEGGNFGVIFEGTIKQFRRGRESATDTYLDILAAVGDQAFNQALVSKSLAAGSSSADRANAAIDAMTSADSQVKRGQIPTELGTGGILPRGAVLFGLGRLYLNDATDAAGMSWSIGPDGTLNMIPLTGYLPGEAVVLNSRTGLIGVPEATIQGVEATCLLNPKIKLGTRVQIDNKSITQTQVNEQGFPRFTDLTFPASTTEDGFYRVLVVEHRGDTRGQEWYTDIICLAVDPSAAPGQSVNAN